MSDPPPQYPVNLTVAGKRCLVVGAGEVAARKAEGLLESGADVVVVGPRVGAGVRRLASAGQVELHERPFEPADLDGAWLAVTATDRPEVNRAVREEADARRVWVNAADDPASCTFTLPSVVRRGAITVAVSTGGRSPALAAWLRRRLEAEIGPEYAVAADLLAAERDAAKAAGEPTESLDWLSALDSGMLDAIRHGDLARAKELLQACLWSSSA